MPYYLIFFFFVFFSQSAFSQTDLKIEEDFLGMPKQGLEIFGLNADNNLKHLAYAVRDEKGMFVRMNKNEGPHFEAIRRGTPLFGPEGHIMAYVGFKNNKSHVLINEREDGVYDGADSFTFSPDGRKTAYRVEKKEKGQAIVFQGKKGPYFDFIDPESIVLSNNSDLAYTGFNQKTGASLIVNGKKIGNYEAARENTFTPDGRFACLVKKDNKWHLFLDGKIEEEGYEGIQYLDFSPDGKQELIIVLKNSKLALRLKGKVHKFYDTIGIPVFSSNSEQLAYPVKEGKKWSMIVNGKKHAKHDFLGPPVFSEDSGQYAWLAIDKEKQSYVINGKKAKSYDSADSFAFSPDGKSFAYRARKQDKWHLITEKGESEAYEGITAPLFHKNGRLLYSIAKDRKQYLVKDGIIGVEADSISPAVFSPDGQHTACAVIIDEKWFLDIDGIRSPVENISAFLNQAPIRFIDENRIQGLAYQLPGPRFLRISASIKDKN